MMRKIFILILLLTIISCTKREIPSTVEQNNFYHFTKNRVAAEWEPAQGVIFMCPPVIPKELIIEFAKDTHIFPVVESEEEQDRALEWFLEWGIDTSRVNFIRLPKVDFDVTVPRDWGPPAVFSKEGQMKLGDVQFLHSAPSTDLACNDSLELHRYPETGEEYHSVVADTLIKPLARKLGFEVLEVPITSTGGNVLVDGIGTALSTCILLTENRYNGVSDEEFLALSDSILGYDNYHVISNFDTYGIQHIDCFLKILDEETLLVAQPPADHELYEVYEGIVNNELSKIKNVYGKAYNIKRIKLGRIVDEYLTAYTNSLILNKTVYVPLYGVETDSQALETWRSVMPGYTVKGFNYVINDQPYKADWFFNDYEEAGEVPGWGPDDALHCRTRAIWKEDMIFISINKIPSKQSVTKNAMLYATIRDYSNAGLEERGIRIYWRTRGSERWNVETMMSHGNEYHWYTEIPVHEVSTVIEYYIETISQSGKSGKRPITAPEGFYEFEYVSRQ